MFLTLHNSLEYPVLVRLADIGNTELIRDVLLATLGPEAIHIAPSAVREAVLAPNGHVQLGPLVFHPTTEGMFSHHFLIMNNYTGLEVVTVAGRAIQQPLLLRDATGVMKTVAVSITAHS